MSDTLHIARLTDLPPGIEALRAEASSEGFRFMDRLVQEWRANTNRFDGAGEALLGAFEAADLMGVCGLNRDPYACREGVGRLRHLYVRKSARRRGIASALVGHLLAQAETAFCCVRLKTETQEAASFYASHGFVAIDDEAASHIRMLRQL